jgi:hypothetical protein
MAWGDIIVKYPGIASQLPPGLMAVAWDYHPWGAFRKVVGRLSWVLLSRRSQANRMTRPV